MTPASRRPPRTFTVCLLMPVLNEAEALPRILPDIDPAWVDEILVVDGGSRDDTVRIVREWGHAKVHIQKTPGLTNGYWEVFPIIESDVILTFSPDGNSIPEAIPALIAKMTEGYDMVIASRYLPGAGSDDDDAVTAFGNWMFTQIVNVAFNGHFSDTLVMLRAYRKSLVYELPMDTRAPAFEPQLAIRCAVHRRPVAEIPAREPKRIGGVRKMRVLANGWAILTLIVREWLRLIELRRPRRSRSQSSRSRAKSSL